MRKLTRRSFIKEGTLGAAAISLATGRAPQAHADPLNVPVGLQLYSVRQVMPDKFEVTLNQVGAIGYKEVEMAGFYSKTAPQILSAMKAAGLRVISAHYGLDELRQNLNEKIDFARQLGLQYMICPGTSYPHPLSPGQKRPPMSLDDWKWNADQFNQVGEQVKKAGMQFGYHNHYNEFKPVDGKIPFDQLLKWCDPELVKIEIDVGWMVYAGFDPVDYMTKHPGRFPQLHVKEMRIGTKPWADLHVEHGLPTTEIGRGEIDWKRVFVAARKGGMKHYYVEQETFPDMPMMEALKADYEYLHRLKV